MSDLGLVPVRVQTGSSKSFARCFMMSYSQPTDDTQNSGSFTRRHRSSTAVHHSGYRNVISCGAVPSSGNRNMSSIVWKAPGNTSVCVEIV